MFFSSVNYSFIEAGNKQPSTISATCFFQPIINHQPSTINFHQRSSSKALHHHDQGHAWKPGDFRHGGCRHHRVGEPRGDQVPGGTEGGPFGMGMGMVFFDPKMTNSCWFMAISIYVCIEKIMTTLQLIYKYICVYIYVYTLPWVWDWKASYSFI